MFFHIRLVFITKQRMRACSITSNPITQYCKIAMNRNLVFILYVYIQMSVVIYAALSCLGLNFSTNISLRKTTSQETINFKAYSKNHVLTRQSSILIVLLKTLFKRKSRALVGLGFSYIHDCNIKKKAMKRFLT